MLILLKAFFASASQHSNILISSITDIFQNIFLTSCPTTEVASLRYSTMHEQSFVTSFLFRVAEMLRLLILAGGRSVGGLYFTHTSRQQNALWGKIHRFHICEYAR